MRKYYLLLLLFFPGLIWSGINPYRFGVWIGETTPTAVSLFILIATFKKFKFTMFSYSAILIACYFMFVGAHYTFARMPLFDWIRDYFGQDRNNFDKVGHFIQGILPVVIAREIFIRQGVVKGYNLISLISICICMAVTSGYELIEFIAASIADKTPVNFLGTQGYVWDSQTDMLFALIGGLFTLLFLRKIHDRWIEKEFPGTFKKFNRFASEADSATL
jgi:putative membrane protein